MPALLHAGYKVVVIDNLSTTFDWLVDPRANLITDNLEDDDLVRGRIRHHGVRAIIHFVGSIIVPGLVGDPLKYYGNHFVTSRALLERSLISGVRHGIFSSIAATHGRPKKMPFGENGPTMLINSYGTSKQITEAMMRNVAVVQSTYYAALRYFNIAGAGLKQRARQSTISATHLIKIGVEEALRKRRAVGADGTDYATPDRIGVRDQINVSDIAAAHGAARDVLDAVDCATHRKLDRRIDGGHPRVQFELLADNRAVHATIDWAPQRAILDTIVADASAWERKPSRVEVAGII
ncbi:MAG: NAD-dependent epimerase/dehydratase family protein [Sphingomonas sp.]|nr:NAD-dependent epimerase/dehydratase family protein [Sphingomonas sp.]